MRNIMELYDFAIKDIKLFLNSVKLKELRLAIRAEQSVEKQEILEVEKEKDHDTAARHRNVKEYFVRTRMEKGLVYARANALHALISLGEIGYINFMKDIFKKGTKETVNSCEKFCTQAYTSVPKYISLPDSNQGISNIMLYDPMHSFALMASCACD